MDRATELGLGNDNGNELCSKEGPDKDHSKGVSYLRPLGLRPSRALNEAIGALLKGPEGPHNNKDLKL